MLLTNQKTINYENLYKNIRKPLLLFLILQMYSFLCDLFNKNSTLT